MSAKKMIAYFENAGIKYLDYSNLEEMTIKDIKEFTIQSDKHPNAKANMIIARRLTRDLGI